MKASEILLSFEEDVRLVVFNTINGKIGVNFQHCDVKDNFLLVDEYGIGDDFESACEDYLTKICGETLVFNAERHSEKKLFSQNKR